MVPNELTLQGGVQNPAGGATLTGNDWTITLSANGQLAATVTGSGPPAVPYANCQ
jgi:hypothetical protein